MEGGKRGRGKGGGEGGGRRREAKEGGKGGRRKSEIIVEGCVCEIRGDEET